MTPVEPIVLKIAETTLCIDSVRQMLDLLGAPEYEEQKNIYRQKPGEALIEIAGRLCYRSYNTEINPNVTKIRNSSLEYFENTLSKGDGSIFEHASVTFAFLNVSRVFTHELVRHRVGVAISQESMRYVRLDNGINFWVPPGTPENILRIMEEAVNHAFETYRMLTQSEQWDTLSMHEKKALTSLFRRILPDGIATNIIWTSNIRNLRHVIEMRTDPSAEIEMRIVFNKVANIMKNSYPNIFNDFVTIEQPDGPPAWTSVLRRKV